MTDKNSVIKFLAVGDLESAEILIKETGIEIHGSSDEFGACDMTLATLLISAAFPGRKVMTRE